MADRIVRDEIWLSERFLDLPTDAARLAFFRFLSAIDDFGNMEGGQRRLFRMLATCTQIKTLDASTATIDALMQADLLRRYTVDDREFFHLPRFKSHRQYLSRMCPPSPWCDPTAELGKEQRVINKGLAKNMVTTSLLHSNLVAEGVGVGVGEVKKQKQRHGANAPFILPDWIPTEQWQAYVEMRQKIRKPLTDYAKRLAVMKLKNYQEQGHPAAQVLMQSAFNGWAGLFPPKEIKA